MGFLSSSQQLSAALSSSNAPSAPRSPPLPAAPLPLISDLGFRVSFAPALLTATRSPLPAHRSLPPALCSPLPAPRASLPAPRSPLRPCAPVPPQLLSAALSSSQQLSAALSSSQQLSAALQPIGCASCAVLMQERNVNSQNEVQKPEREFQFLNCI